MARISADLFRGFASSADEFDADARSRRANRRRLIVFLSVFGALLFFGLVWDFSRPAVYQASARLDFVPANAPAASVTATTPDASSTGRQYSLRDEVQYLTSRTLLAKVWDALKDRSGTPAAMKGGDPTATLQAMLAVRQVPGTNIVALEASGGEPAFLPVFVDQLITDYRASLDERFKGGSTTALADAQDESQKLESVIADKRREVDAFRAKHNIVSLERDENQVLAEVKGTSASLNTATEKVVAAEARLAAIREAQGAGRSIIRARDNPTLASLEGQASAIRSELQAIARQFTPEYMKIDPRVRELRARQADAEEQIATIRRESGRAAIQEAQEEVASTRGAATALRQQVAANQASVQNFTSNLGVYKSLQDQLTHLELQRQISLDRLSTLDAGERGRKPKVDIVEQPSVPQSASSPLYARDAAVVLFAALFIALATMGIVEFFNRSPAPPATVVVPQTWAPVGMSHLAPTALPGAAARAALPDVEHAMALPAPLPRELTDGESTALLHAADPEFRAVMALFLTGLTPNEVVALRRGDVDRASGRIAVNGADPRTTVLPPHVVAWLPVATEPVDAPVFVAADGRVVDAKALETALLYAAHDAGIDAADEITPQTLRHTYVAFLLRQGLRFTDVARLVGSLPPDRLTAYKQLSPGGTPPSPDAVARVLPALREAVG